MRLIRFATLDDLDFMLDLCREFYIETGSDKYYNFDPKSVEITLRTSVAYNFSVTDGVNGLFTFNVYPSFYDYSEHILAEIFFYVRKDLEPMKRGIIAYNLLKRIDAEAKKHRVKHVKINSLIYYNHENMDGLYRRFGYEKRESQYMKEK